MIDFACKQFDINEIIKCGFGLTRSEYKIFHFLVKNPQKEADTNKISKQTGFDLTTVQKAVKKIYGHGLIIRRQKNLAKGGYTFTYMIKSKEEIRDAIKKIIRNWTKTVEENIDRW